MNEADQKAANEFIHGYIERKRAQGEWSPTAVGLMRVAYGAACEAKQNEQASDLSLAAALIEQNEAERARSAKLIKSLRQIVTADFKNYAVLAYDAIAEYEAGT